MRSTFDSMLSSPLLFLAGGVLLFATACVTPTPDRGSGGGADSGPGDPVAAVEIDHSATETLTQNLTSNVEELDIALDFLTASDLLPELFKFGLEEEDGGRGEPREVSPGDDPRDGRSDEDSDEPIVVDVDLDRPLAELLDAIQERLLVESTIEDDGDARTVIYLLDGERICRDDEEAEDEDDGDDGDEAEECRRQLRDVPVRVRVTSSAEGDIDLALLIGPDRLSVLVVRVHRNLLGVQLDLGAARAAADLFLVDDEAALPDVVEGVVRAELRRNGERDFTGLLAIDQEIRIEHQGDGADDEMSLRIGATESLVSVRIDGFNQMITAQLGLGEVELALPWQTIVDALHGGASSGGCAGTPDGEFECWEDEPEPAPQVEGVFRAFLAGLTGQTSFSGSEDRIEFTDLTLGSETSTVRVAGDTLIAFDFNKDAGRKAAIAIQEVRNGNIRIEVAPELDLVVKFALHHVQDVFDDLPSFMLDETLGVRMDGAGTPALETVGDGEDRQLRVADGDLTLWSTAMDDDVIVSEGQCLAGLDEDGGDESEGPVHGLWGALRAQSCDL